jgi:hypothetical protein
MDKKEALRILIESSLVLTKENKEKLLIMLETMSDEKIKEWGELLLTEQNFLDKNGDKIW